MIEDLKSYPETKDSGLAWLGHIPVHWEIKRGKSYLQAIDKRSESGEEELLTMSSTRGVIPRRSANVTMFKAKTYAGHKLCWPGDLVINSLWAWNGGLGVSQHHGIVSTAYGVYRARDLTEVNPHYLHELLRSSAFQWELQVRSKGVWISRLQLTDTAFLDAPIPMPPPEEQEAIARFLTWATNRLDRAIGAKRRVIAFLQEQKQAIIHHAVTRGLDPSVPLKDTGIPWLGEIPEHWKVRPFVRCTIERGDYRGATPEKVESGVFLVTAKNVRRGWIDYEASKEYVRASEYLNIMRRGLPKKGDVLLTMEAPLGHIALIDREDIALAQRIIRFRLHPELLLPEFSLLCLDSAYFQNQLHERATGSTAQGLKASKLPQLIVALPPISEQRKIVERVMRDCAPADTVIARLEHEIQLLREYRTCLIADVVTGKLDVREVGAGLPEEIEPLDVDEPADEIEELEPDEVEGIELP